MKNNFIIILIIFFLPGCQNIKNDSKEKSVYDKFEIKRGTNLSHWLSQSSRRGEERRKFITRSDIEYISLLGFDHVRIPIDEEQMWDEQGNRETEAFTLLDSALHWCYDFNLRAVVDLHILRSHHFNAAEKPLWTEPAEQEEFIDLWRDLSNHLQDWPEGMVAYELMNEPVADDPELWNILVANAVAAIREMEPDRQIVIGSNRFQSVHTFDDLKIPEADTNIVLSFHFYEPFLLTHYQAGWTFLDDYQGPVHYPGAIITEEEWQQLDENYKNRLKSSSGKEFNRQVMADMMQQPLAKAENTGLSLYCGEFGVIKNAPRADMLQWYKDMIAIFDQQGVAYANWDYKSDNFGLLDYDGEPDQELIDIVLGKE